MSYNVNDKILNVEIKKSELMYLVCLIKSNIDTTEQDINNIKNKKNSLDMPVDLLNDYMEYLERNKQLYYYFVNSNKLIPFDKILFYLFLMHS